MFVSGSANSDEWSTTSGHEYNTAVPTNRFYGSSQPLSTHYDAELEPQDSTQRWLPGQTIPIVANDIHAILAEMQCCITREFDRLNGAIEDISHRLDAIENTMASHAVTIESLPSVTPTTSPSCEGVGSGKRKRHVPTELTVSEQRVYNCLSM